MKLNISCAAKIYPIEVDVEHIPSNVDNRQTTSAEKDNAVNISTTYTEKISTLGSFKQLVCSLCNISPTALKIVHRGRILMGDNSTPLSSFNFKENDKLLVLGKPPTTETDVGWKLLVDFERKHTVNISKTYATNENDLTQLEKNFLKDPERRGYIKGMDKRLKGYAENCMKLLETLDGLQINNDNTEKEQAQRNREKRKFLVDGLQDALNKNDKLMTRLTDYLNRCEHPEDAL
ncbi:BAG domain-containing protein [Loa loa]|uniref:BAG domain-containing protein n=1 Tax=Loa loa TaxID=7209 RepID=A0A1S0TRU6_LOALO|nr:BAG domain-containing protein [Loa loa]EFO18949.2 BAG domain-containing protein [Loa loa]